MEYSIIILPIDMMLSEIQIDILKFLVEFKQLTIPQFIRLIGNECNYQKVYRPLKKLLERRRPMVTRVEYNKVNHFGKLSYVYSITKLGVKTLKNLSKQNSNSLIFSPIEPKLTTDYFHRTRTIDFHISLYLHLQNTSYKIQYCSHYFMVEKSGKKFISRNKITYSNVKSIIPDSIYSIGNKEKQRFLLFEFHNGKSKQRIVDQIEQHAIVLTNLNAHSKYNIPKNKFYYILIVFEERATMEGTISIIQETNRYKNIASFILFKPISELEDDLFSNWINLKGEVSEIQI